MRLLAFAFAGTVAEDVAALLPSSNTVMLASSRSAIESFVADAEFTAYDFVLGLGAYSGRDRDALRIETECSNRFRNSGSAISSISIPYFLRPAAKIKLTNGIGNSWCNLVSYTILTNSLHAPYTFIHIPKDFDPAEAADTIRQQLRTLKI